MMPGQTLAQTVKAKYPGVYDDIPDTELETKVKTKYPGVYDDFPTTQPSKQSETADAPSWLGSAVKFAEGVGSQINPIEIAKGIYGAVTSPIETVKGLGQAQIDQFKRGKEMYDQGRYSEAVGHALAGALPLVGPAAANIGEDIGAGNVAHGLGSATGLIGTVVAPSLAKPAAKALDATGIAEPIAAKAAQRSGEVLSNVMAPKVGANKARFGNLAAKVAPAVAAEPGLGALSAKSLAAKVSERFEQAQEALDAAAEARNPGAAYPTAPIVKSLQDAKARLVAPAVEASQVTPTSVGEGLVTRKSAVPMGQDVLPAENAARAAKLDQAIKEVQQLGPMARYDALKTIRQSYDKVAKAGGKYAPSVTQDYLKVSEGANGAADAAASIREALAGFSPETAAANQQYTTWKNAHDVMQATMEIERTRPTVGRTIVARVGGMIAGKAVAGTAGEVVGLIIAPLIDAAASAANQGRKIMYARTLASVSSALRTGNAAVIETALKRARVIGLSAKTQKQEPPQ